MSTYRSRQARKIWEGITAEVTVLVEAAAGLIFNKCRIVTTGISVERYYLARQKILTFDGYAG